MEKALACAVRVGRIERDWIFTYGLDPEPFHFYLPGPRMEYRTWMCLVCGFIYKEAEGIPDEGIAPGTRWQDVPVNWTCPECGARKEDFEMLAI